jgi:ABC-2 type transport system ATP-binding protein
MLDLIPLDDGAVIIDGHPIARSFPIALKRRLGVFLGDNLLIEELTGKDFIAFIAGFYEVYDWEIRLEALLDILRFDAPDAFRRESIASYSLGMKRKVALISALLHEPEYLLLDEPFSSLDATGVERLIAYLIERKPHCRMIISSHILSYLEMLADRYLYLERGRVRHEGLGEGLPFSGNSSKYTQP